MGKLSRVMIVLNGEAEPRDVWSSAAKLREVPGKTRGTAHLLAQAVRELSDHAGLEVGIASLDPKGLGLAGYVGSNNVVHLRRDISPDEAAAGVVGLANKFDLLLVDATYDHDYPDIDPIVELAVGFATGAKSVGAEARVALPPPLIGESISPNLVQRRFQSRVPCQIVSHYSPAETSRMSPGGVLFPVTISELVYNSTRGMSLRAGVAQAPVDDGTIAGFDEFAIELWLHEAARSDLLQWFFGKVVSYPALN